MKKITTVLAVVLLAATFITGCATSNSSDTTTPSPANAQSATTQQKLADLQRSRDRGLITDAQYQEQKTWLLHNQ